MQEESIRKSNQELLLMGEQQKTRQKLLEKLETPNYFPFTHGDLIEHNRKQLGRLNLMELQRVITERENKKL